MNSALDAEPRESNNHNDVDSDEEQDTRRDEDGEGVGLTSLADAVETILADPQQAARDFFTSVWREGVLSVRYIFSDSRRHPRNLFIAILTIVVVVGFIALMQTVVLKSPLVFLKLSENQVGEFDLVLTPRVQLGGGSAPGDIAASLFNGSAPQPSFANSTQVWVNWTYVHERTAQLDRVRGSAPRWTALGRVFNRYDSSLNSSIIVLVIDSEQEKDVGIGRDWNKRALGEAECYVTNSVLRAIGTQPNAGERLYLGFDLIDVAVAMGLQAQVDELIINIIKDTIRNSNITADTSQVDMTELLRELGVTLPPGVSLPQTNTTITIQPGRVLTDAAIDALARSLYSSLRPFVTDSLSAQNLRVELTVVDGVDEPHGKWPTALGNVLILEKKWLSSLLVAMLPTNEVIRRNLLQSFGFTGENGTTPEDQLLNFPIDNSVLFV